MLDKDALVALVRLTEDQVYKSLDADVDAVVRRNLPKQQAAEEIADLLDFQIDEICMEVFN